MTIGEAIDAYRTLQSLSPQSLSREMLDEIVDAAQALEPVATAHQERVQKHLERIGGDVSSVEELTDEEQAELQEVVQDLRSEEAEIDAPAIDPRKATSIAAMREIQSVGALQPLLD
jgi:F0F1-type ATP synthase delta subunit